MADERSCRTCVHWIAWEGEIGKCTRFPPKVTALISPTIKTSMSVSQELQYATRFPMTRTEEHCGEWSKRP